MLLAGLRPPSLANGNEDVMVPDTELDPTDNGVRCFVFDMESVI